VVSQGQSGTDRFLEAEDEAEMRGTFRRVYSHGIVPVLAGDVTHVCRDLYELVAAMAHLWWGCNLIGYSSGGPGLVDRFHQLIVGPSGAPFSLAQEVMVESIEIHGLPVK
jgi:hypothetical protein